MDLFLLTQKLYQQVPFLVKLQRTLNSSCNLSIILNLKNKDRHKDGIHTAPLERLELSLSAPEADALSTELQGRAQRFYHKVLFANLISWCG